MDTETDKILKIRFRFSGGEEFEAQGTPEFIEKQRNYFLNLIGKSNCPHPLEPQSRPETTELPAIFQTSQHLPQAMCPPDTPDQSASPFPLPSLSQGSSFRTAQRGIPAAATKHPWEVILKTEGEMVILRKKMRFTAQESALILTAGARILLKKPILSALQLSHALRQSGFSAGRLDRLLAGEIASGYLTGQGSKRSRTYRITDQGFARAFVLAEKAAAGEI